ncbi:hypothetical protein ACLMAJ_30300 [Nocardia sp. KC 131]|uniref:hypothetical protein n=1 Tax=Nocardia arseniciresistens TaxID=3392119 RepID=UPI00398EE719
MFEVVDTGDGGVDEFAERVELWVGDAVVGRVNQRGDDDFVALSLPARPGDCPL